ncbi:smoothelin-like protein 1 [Arapaima gigas]
MSFSFTVQVGDGQASSRTCSVGETAATNPDSGPALQSQLDDASQGVENLDLSPSGEPQCLVRAAGAVTVGSHNSQPGQQVQTVHCSASPTKVVGSPAGPAAARVPRPRCSASSRPDARNVKQMLLDWCRAKTRNYENVHIHNFSSSWSNGLAFCALVHNFFPTAFDYSTLRPSERRHNFHTAFRAAESLADCPPLLDVDDLLKMEEPDWKCIYTYIQELYRCLVEKGLVKTKKSR